MGAQASRTRKRLLETAEQMRLQLSLLLEERGPFIRGSFGVRRRVCGNPGCHCARGELHESKYLTATDQRRVRQVHVPAAEEAKVAAGVDRYRRFRRSSARLVALSKRQLELIDELGHSLLEPYPPRNPLPPPLKRGRPPKGG